MCEPKEESDDQDDLNYDFPSINPSHISLNKEARFYFPC
jgi:hypothetical protein